MKKTMISLCAVAIMTGSAWAQQQSTPVPAGQSPPPVVAPQPPSSPVPTHDSTTTIEQSTVETTTIENRSDNDVSEAVEPVAPPIRDIDSRVDNQPAPITPVPPVPNPEEQPRDITPPVERNDDVSNLEERSRDTSADSYEPALNYDTDNDGILDTNEYLRGPITPEQSQQQPTP